MMKSLILNDTSNECHWGSFGTVSALRGKFPNADSVATEDLQRLVSVPENADEFEDFADKFIELNPIVVEKIRTADLVITNGEGTLHNLWDRQRALLYLVWLSKERFKKPVVIINHSCFLESDKKRVLGYYRKAYSAANFIAARESMSVKEIKKLGVTAKQSFDCLPLAIQKIEKLSIKSKGYILLGGAVNWKNTKTKIIAFLLKLFFPNRKFIFLTGSNSPCITNETDFKIGMEFKKHIKNLAIYDAKSLQDWLGVLSGADYLISGRFHFDIAAMAFGVPSIAFESNTPKTSGARKMMGRNAALKMNSPFFVIKFLWELLNLRNMDRKPVLKKMCNLAENNFNFEI